MYPTSFNQSFAVLAAPFKRWTMCPFCLANLGLIVAGTIPTGGLAALAVKMSLKKKDPTETIPNAKERSDENDRHSQ